jgi:hypothetical protein
MPLRMMANGIVVPRAFRATPTLVESARREKPLARQGPSQHPRGYKNCGLSRRAALHALHLCQSGFTRSCAARPRSGLTATPLACGGQVGAIAQLGALRLLLRQCRTGPLGEQVPFFLGQGSVNVQHEAETMFARIRWPETNGAPVCPHCGGQSVYNIRNVREQGGVPR